jgi:hypothetical protein
MGQKSHGGIELNRSKVGSWTAADFHNHGRVPRSDLLGFGGGIDFLATQSLDVFATFMKTVGGRNEHAINAQFTLGFSIGFSPRQVIRRMSGPDSARLAPGY